MLISMSNVSDLLQNGHFPVQSILAAIFVTITTVKVNKLKPDFYTRAIVLLN